MPFKEPLVTQTHMDAAVLEALQDVMEADYPLLLETFVSDSQTRLAQMGEAARDAEALAQAAHSLKGSSSNMGALRLAELCRDLEARAKDMSAAQTDRLLAEIGLEMDTVQRLYDTERRRFPA
jgi:HPt (histidine-containing phosphotransfer) domain-containing protein